MAEYWDIYDKNFEKINKTVKRGDKLEDNEYMLKIPNYEIQTFFKKGFIDKFLVSRKKIKSLNVKM